MDVRDRIAKKIANELKGGDVVNLGIGIPTLVTKFIGNKNVYVHSENGILGIGPPPNADKVDVNIVNAGKKPVTILPGSSFFDSNFSFAMIRGGHIDVAVLGALQVDANGLIANWAVPGESVLGVGGAMDLLEGAKKIIIATTHTTKDGKPKIVNKLNYPATSKRKADLIITELATFSVDENGIFLKEIDKHSSLEELREKTRIKLNPYTMVNNKLEDLKWQ